MFGAIMGLSLFSLTQCIIKQLLDSVFVTSKIIKVSVSVISLSLRLPLITLTSTLIIPDITKTSSNYIVYYQVLTINRLTQTLLRLIEVKRLCSWQPNSTLVKSLEFLVCSLPLLYSMHFTNSQHSISSVQYSFYIDRNENVTVLSLVTV